MNDSFIHRRKFSALEWRRIRIYQSLYLPKLNESPSRPLKALVIRFIYQDPYLLNYRSCSETTWTGKLVLMVPLFVMDVCPKSQVIQEV